MYTLFLLLTIVLVVAAYQIYRFTYWLRFDYSVLRGKRVIVCGASTGIGKEVALVYASQGAHVAITSRRQELLEQVAEECENAGAASVKVIAADLATEDGVKRVISEGISHFNVQEGASSCTRPFDILVLNHVYPFFDHWDDVKDKINTTRKLFEVNTLSYIALCEEALPHLRKFDRGEPGSLIVVSSLAGKLGLPLVAPYSMCKHALHGFFNSLRHDIALSDNRGLQITMCVLGSIGTDAAKHNIGDKLTKVPWYDPRDCALAIVKAGGLFVREMYFPYVNLKLITIIHIFGMDATDRLIRFVMR